MAVQQNTLMKSGHLNVGGCEMEVSMGCSGSQSEGSPVVLSGRQEGFWEEVRL